MIMKVICTCTCMWWCDDKGGICDVCVMVYRWLLVPGESGFTLQGEPDPPTFYQTLGQQYGGTYMYMYRHPHLLTMYVHVRILRVVLWVYLFSFNQLPFCKVKLNIVHFSHVWLLLGSLFLDPPNNYDSKLYMYIHVHVVYMYLLWCCFNGHLSSWPYAFPPHLSIPHSSSVCVCVYMYLYIPTCTCI